MSLTAPDAAHSKRRAWPPDGLERVEHCPVCGSSTREQLYRGQTDRVFRCAPGRWDLYQCNICHTAYLDPRPTPATIHLAYQSYYTHKPTKRQATEALSTPRRLMRSLANGYRNRRYNGNLKPMHPLGPYLMPLFWRYRAALDRELRYLPPLKPGSRLLDVGSGSGAFMFLAQRIGWQVSGVDPDPVAVARAHQAKLDVRQGGIEAFDDAREQFDVITMSHVIEHVHDPVHTLTQAYALLKWGGLLYIDTPNIEALGHTHFKQYWRGLEIPRHLVLMNWDAMHDILIKVGFDEIKQLRIPTPYARLAAASRAIRAGNDPYILGTPNYLDKLNALGLRLSLLSDKRKSEFITLYALKPRQE